jgi:hypothetical protein
MRHILHPNNVLDVTVMCCYVLTEAEVSNMRHIYHSGTVLTSQICAVK